MIKNQDRSGWFGASDTCHMMGGFQTRTFARFWLEKQGLRQNRVRTPQMLAGSAYEHRILAAIGVHQMQAQVEMFAANKPLEIVAYRLEPEDYENFYRPIDPARITRHPVLRDEAWLQEQYLPRLRYLAWCLKRGRFPSESDLS